MSWKFSLRKRFSLGPLRFNTSGLRVTSWGWKLGPWTRNVTRGTDSVNTPGPGTFQRNRSRR